MDGVRVRVLTLMKSYSFATFRIYTEGHPNLYPRRKMRFNSVIS